MKIYCLAGISSSFSSNGKNFRQAVKSYFLSLHSRELFNINLLFSPEMRGMSWNLESFPKPHLLCLDFRHLEDRHSLSLRHPIQ